MPKFHCIMVILHTNIFRPGRTRLIIENGKHLENDQTRLLHGDTKNIFQKTSALVYRNLFLSLSFLSAFRISIISHGIYSYFYICFSFISIIIEHKHKHNPNSENMSLPDNWWALLVRCETRKIYPFCAALLQSLISCFCVGLVILIDWLVDQFSCNEFITYGD
jgi:hypothetical protein